MFITFEGGEGAGKSTQITLLARFLEKKMIDYLLTREPGGTVIGKSIRSILLSSDTKALDHKAELFLYAADRAQHIETIIKPALRSGKVVLCDRFADSTTAYQGYARGLDMDLVKGINKIVLGELQPHITFLLDLPPETGVARALKRMDAVAQAEDESRFESEKMAFHQRIRMGFLELAEKEPERFIVIDATRSESWISEQIIQAITPFLH